MRTDLLKDAARSTSRLVVKLGTGVLTDARKQPDLAQMDQLVAQVAAQRQLGRDVILVSSGAVGAGMGVLKHDKRPTELAELQACAAVGQSRLMTTYESLFAKHGLHVAQVLLTHDDLQHHERHLNARNTLVRLLKHGVVPSSTKTTQCPSPKSNSATTTNSPRSSPAFFPPTSSLSSPRSTASS